jgi:hypothetical protein
VVRHQPSKLIFAGSNPVSRSLLLKPMASIKDWLNRKFIEWEKTQGGRQSYYAFAHFLGVSQSELSAWMTGSGSPSGDDLLAVAGKLGPEVYDILGLPRPDADLQRVTVSFASLPPDIRQNLTNAISEASETLRQQHLRPESPESREVVLEILAKWGFRYSK